MTYIEVNMGKCGTSKGRWGRYIMLQQWRVCIGYTVGKKEEKKIKNACGTLQKKEIAGINKCIYFLVNKVFQ